MARGKIVFAVGDKVRFAFPHARGVSKGSGTVKKAIPKGAQRGAARLVVKDAEGREWRPFASQCKRA